VGLKKSLGRIRRQFVTEVFQRRVSLGLRRPIVSFTFDDFPRTALTVGGEILKSYGARGTYYAAMKLMNSVTEVGEQFRQSDLENLLRDGHELASHTFSHVSCRSMSAHSFREEVLKGQSSIGSLLGRNDRRNFSFPYGDVTLRAKRSISSDVASSRSIWGGFNGPVTDLSLLRANRLYGDLESYSNVQDLILENERRNNWLIFYSHDVQSTPSRVGCTPALLNFAVSFALQRRACICTVGDVLAQIESHTADLFACK
jgi:peptidoglycan/xylan/chitin deacetylase (PgdA/CDA1 family)